MKKNNIVVLGKFGQLAKSIKENIKIQNVNIKFLSSNNINFLNKNFNLRSIKKFNPKIIINCFAYTQVDKAEIEKKKANLINNIALKKLAHYCKKNKVFLIHFSTDYIFSGKKKNFLEKDKHAPINYYGYTKSMGEKKIISSKCKYLILRISWTYSKYGNNFLKTICKNLNRNKKMKIVNDQLGCPTSLKMVCDFLRYIILIYFKDKLNLPDIVNISPKGKTSWYKYAKFIERNIYSKSNSIKSISSKKFKSNAKRPRCSKLNNTKLIKKYKFKVQNWMYYLKDTFKKDKEYLKKI